MDEKIRCQSCGMPLGIGFYGTNSDQSLNNEYCKLCFAEGNFREADLTLDQMMGRSMAHMIDELQMNPDEAEQKAREYIPNLKRWAKQTTDN